MTTEAQTRNCRILVIDDNASIHEDFRSILTSNGNRNEQIEAVEAALFDEPLTVRKSLEFTMDSAFQGREGWLKVQQAAASGQPYAVAFVDMRMPPGWDGVETIHRIWQADPDVQIVVCTAYSDYSREEMIQQIGYSDNMVILKKPFEALEALQLAYVLTAKWGLGQQIKRLSGHSPLSGNASQAKVSGSLNQNQPAAIHE